MAVFSNLETCWRDARYGARILRTNPGYAARVTSESGLLLVRELDERLGLSALITHNIMEDRRGKNTQ
jgi:hypothetical protein